ncbi:hypothetical protein GCM10027295_25670 [Pseudaeromonas pectinilytica]
MESGRKADRWRQGCRHRAYTDVFTASLRFVQTPVTREQYLSTHNGYIAKKKPPKFGGKRGVNISA